MEGALSVLELVLRIPWGGLSCANLFHNDWNVTDTEALKTHRLGYTHSELLRNSGGICAHFIASLRCLVLKNFLFLPVFDFWLVLLSAPKYK